jgi:hypothetical protein
MHNERDGQMMSVREWNGESLLKGKIDLLIKIKQLNIKGR